MFNLRFNRDQKLELGKALFNLGNLFFSTMLLGQVVLNNLDMPIFIIGSFSFAGLYALAIIAMGKENV